MDTKEQVRDTIVKLLKIKPQELVDGSSLEQSLGVDSTEMVEICIALQKGFGVAIKDKEVSKQHSVEDIARVIDEKKKAVRV